MGNQKEKGKIKKMLNGEGKAHSLDDLDFGDRDFLESQQQGPKEKNHDNMHNSDNVGKLKSFFYEKLGFSFLRDQIPEEELEKKDDYEQKDYTYWQMELDLEKYGDEFEKEIEQAEKSGVSVREATEDDLEIIAKLYNRAFMKGDDPWSPITPQQVREIMNYRNSFILIASVHGEDVAFMILDLEGEDNEIGIICGLGTDPTWRRHGYARHLGLIAWHILKEKEVEKIRCEVYEKNIPSRELIESLYFKKYGEKVYQF